MTTGLPRAKCILFAGAAVLLSLATAPAHAQGYPSGSYVRSCTNIQSYGGQITADCRRMDGSWDRTTLYGAHRCAGGVANTDGRLTCSHGRHVGSSEYDRWQGDGYRRGYEGDYGYDGGYDRWYGYSGSSGYQPYGGYDYGR
jgi:hypothetical protein